MSGSLGLGSTPSPSEPLIPEELSLDGSVNLDELLDQRALPLEPEGRSATVQPTLLLLNRPHALDGVGLLAFCSALIGPLSLEVIFVHRDLWFETEASWQRFAVSMLWRAWLLLGSLLLVGWGMNRAATGGVAGHVTLVGVEGLISSANPQRHYASLVTLIGSCTYLIFGLPTWWWVHQLGLSTDESGIFIVGVSLLSLILIPQLLTFASATSKRREWILLTLGVIWIWLITRWIWSIG